MFRVMALVDFWLHCQGWCFLLQAGAVPRNNMCDYAQTRPSLALAYGRGKLAASVIAACAAGIAASPACAQGIEQFFTNPRLVDKVAPNTATDALELSKDQVLWTALAFEDVEQLRQLLKRGANPNKPEELSMMTPLMAAETFPITWALLEAGADPLARDRAGRTVLHYAVKMRDAPDIIELLARTGADINAKSEGSGNVTPLFYAVERYIEDPDKATSILILRMLIQKGADIDAIDNSGATVVARAAAQNQPELIKLLVELGADASKRLGNGRTPLDYAREANAREAIQLLAGITSRTVPAN